MIRAAERLQAESLRRMRWRLWFAFRDSKYSQFSQLNHKGEKLPHYDNIKKYCAEHWGTQIGMMEETELAQKIAIVLKWKEKK